jgi:hypothetical protein
MEDKMKRLYTTIALIFFTSLLINANLNAQEKLNDKINKIDGEVQKITITADGKEYLFEGDEAAKLFEKMKSSKSQSFVWNSSDDESTKKKVIILDADGENEVIEIESEDDNVYIIRKDKDLDNVSDGITKKVKVEIEDGNKKVTVTTKENGEEKTEIYEGKEAEEYIEKMKAENKDFNISIEENKDGKKVKKIIIETDKEVE